MRASTKRQLNQYFKAPNPLRKDVFIRQVEKRNVSQFQLMKTQFRYITKTAWICSVALCFCILLLSGWVDREYLGMVCAATPFLAMIGVSESMRSYRHGMYELEQSSRFGLKSILLSRMAVMGAVDFSLLLLASIFSGQHMLSQLLYMAVPYMIAVSAELAIVRKMPGIDSMYLCFGCSATVALFVYLISARFRFLYEMGRLGSWLLVGVILVGVMCREVYRTIQMTEELAWN